MKVQYVDDPIAGGGHGILVFSEAEFPAPPLSYAIMRGSDHQYATGKQNAWTGEKVFFPVEETPAQDGVLQISVGPALVDSLNQQETYAVFLRGGNGEEKRGRLQVHAITYSPDGVLDNTGRVTEEENIEGKPANQDIELPIQKAVAQNKPENQQKPLDMPEPASVNKTKSRVWRWLIIVLLALGCLIWFLLDTHKNKSVEEDKSTQAPTPAKIEKPVPAPQTPGMNSAEPRIMFKGKEVSPSAAAIMVRELPRSSKSEQDDIYRLLYFAARHGEASVLMEYGACLDPSKPAWGTIGKDAPLAYEAYAKARKKYPQEAEKSQQDLLKWLKANASKNNQARVWLDEIYK